MQGSEMPVGPSSGLGRATGRYIVVLANSIRHGWMPALLLSACLLSVAWAQDGPDTSRQLGANARPDSNAAQAPAGQTPPAYRLAEHSSPTPHPRTAHLTPAQANEHPLMPALRWARDGIGNVERLQDYSATLVKRERVSGKVAGHEYIFLKVRHKPFSVYMCFLGPAALKGREVIYIRGQNDGKMWAHGTGLQKTMFGTVSLPPDGLLAMRGQRYPLTEVGLLNLVRRLIEVAEEDTKYGECDVKFFKGAKINDRICTCIQVVHPVPRRNFLFHLARIFVDDEFNVPVRYEAYDWPGKEGAAPELIEEYTYLNLKLNNGFADADFDTRNPSYRFD